MSSNASSGIKKKALAITLVLVCAYIAIGVGIIVRGKAMLDTSSILEVLHVSTRLALSGNRTNCAYVDGFLLNNFCNKDDAIQKKICGCEVVKYRRAYTLLEKVLSKFYLTHVASYLAPIPEFFGSKVVAYIPRYVYMDDLLYSTILSSIKDPKQFLENYQESQVLRMPSDIDNDTIRHEKFYLSELRKKYKSIDVYVTVVDDDNDSVGRVVEVVSANLQ